MFKYALNVPAKDKVSGLKGTITGRAEYIEGGPQYLLQPNVLLNGVYQDPRWFDESRIAYEAPTSKPPADPLTPTSPVAERELVDA